MVDPFMKSPEGLAELMVVIKETHETLAFGEAWHSDNTYLERPPLGSFLYALEVPPMAATRSSQSVSRLRDPVARPARQARRA